VPGPPDPEPSDVVAEAVYGVEGPGGLLPDIGRIWEDPSSREALLRVARDAESDARLMLLSAHLLAVARVS
jgi:hypothetical protein